MIDAHHFFAMLLKFELEQQRLGVHFIMDDAVGGDVLSADDSVRIQAVAPQDAADFFGFALAGMVDDGGVGGGG